MPNSNCVHVSKIKGVINQYALDLIVEYEKYIEDKAQRIVFSSQLHVLEMVCLHMGWVELDEKITKWRTVCESRLSK